MSTLTPRLSFRIILFAIAVIGTVPTLAFSGLLLLRYAQSERQRAERVLVENARGIARAIDAQFNEAEAMILALRTSPALETDDLSEFESRLRRTAAESGRHFALIAPNGQQLINTFLPPGQPLPRNELGFWAPAVNERRTYVTNVFAGTTTGQLLAGVGVPVMRGETVKWILASGLFCEGLCTGAGGTRRAGRLDCFDRRPHGTTSGPFASQRAVCGQTAGACACRPRNERRDGNIADDVA
jgi:hypothetical protein